MHIIVPIVSITSPSPSSILDCNDYASPVAEIPIQILLINDGSMGVAFLRHSTVLAWSSNDAPTFSKSQVRTFFSNRYTCTHQSKSSQKLRLIQFRTKKLLGQSLSSQHLSGQPAGMDQRWVNHSDWITLALVGGVHLRYETHYGQLLSFRLEIILPRWRIRTVSTPIPSGNFSIACAPSDQHTCYSMMKTMGFG